MSSAILAVEVKQRIDFFPDQCFLHDSDEDAVGSKLMVIDPAAEERGLSVRQPGRTAAIQIPAAGKAERVSRPIREHLGEVSLITVQYVDPEMSNVLH